MVVWKQTDWSCLTDLIDHTLLIWLITPYWSDWSRLTDLIDLTLLIWLITPYWSDWSRLTDLTDHTLLIWLILPGWLQYIKKNKDANWLPSISAVYYGGKISKEISWLLWFCFWCFTCSLEASSISECSKTEIKK